MWIVFIALLHSVSAQTKGTLTPNFLPPLSSTFNGNVLPTRITLDANWRWSRSIRDNPQGTGNCFTSSWNRGVCPDPVTCTKNCALEGVSEQQWRETYGITSNDRSVTLRYVTQGPYGVNVGSRIYLMAPNGNTYQPIEVMGKQFVMTVDVSKLPCGLNGAVYFVEMPLDGGLNTLNTAGAAFGTGYGDAQCPKDIKYINGFTNLNNTGACSNEMDIWEANSFATAFTPHPCSIQQVYGCTDDVSCGVGSNRFKGVCDKNGADYNPFRNGDRTLYGPGSGFKVDTTQPFELVTQFITHDGTSKGDLVEIKRFYRQHGKLIPGGSLTDANVQAIAKKRNEDDHFTVLGGMKAMGVSLRRKHVLVLSLWDDNSSAQMRWLDSVYPPGSTKPSDLRGPCPTDDNRDVNLLRSKHAKASVTYSNIRVEPISGSVSPSPSPTPTPPKKWVCQQCVQQ